MLIRKITENDLEQVNTIEQAAYTNPWTPKIFQDCLKENYQAWLLEDGATYCGYGIYTTIIDEAHLLNLCINPKFQGLGFSKQLLSFLISKATWQQLRIMHLEVRASNKTAQHLYLTAGFACVGRRKNYYLHDKTREDALLFSLSLIS